MAGDANFLLDPSIDEHALRRTFAEQGRIQVSNFLAGDGAERLRHQLVSSSQWRMVINGGRQVFEIPRHDFEALPADERSRIETAIHTAARSDFQFRYETIRVPDGEAERAASGRLIDNLANFLSSAEVIALIERITGFTDMAFADAQATRYVSGDFLTTHDDAVEGKNRRLAYVLGLTPGWVADWGGLLHFIAADGIVEQTFLPRFNALTLFAIGQPHSVSVVAPFAGEARLSVTGWFRTARD